MTEDPPIPEHFAADGCLYYRALPDDQEITVWPMTYGKARLCIGLQQSMGYEDGYCYESRARALKAARLWSGEGDPLDGWHRHLNSGRRREGGDPAKETVRW